MQIITFEGSWTMKPKELWKQMSTSLSNQRMPWRTFWPSLKSWTPSEKRKKRLKERLWLQTARRSSSQSSSNNNNISQIRGKEKRTKRNNLRVFWLDYNCTYNVQNDGMVYLSKCFAFWWDNFKSVVVIFILFYSFKETLLCFDYCQTMVFCISLANAFYCIHLVILNFNIYIYQFCVI